MDRLCFQMDSSDKVIIHFQGEFLLYDKEVRAMIKNPRTKNKLETCGISESYASISWSNVNKSREYYRL